MKREEYQGGYARTKELEALFAAKRGGNIGKNELRVFCARLEFQEGRGRVTQDVILNKKAKRRFTSGQQKTASERLDGALAEFTPEKELTTKIPRPFLRAAARGKLKASQIWAGLVFFFRRMPQRSRRTSLVRGERYARFTLEIARQITSLARSTLCTALQALRKLKLIACVWRPMQEIKRFGPLYVDGPAVSVYYKKGEHTRWRGCGSGEQKRRTETTENANAIHETPPENAFSRRESIQDTLERLRARFC